MNLTPHTTSPEFLNAYIGKCMDAGIDQSLVENHYHSLRLKEASLDPDIREGMEKAAGPYTKAFKQVGKALKGKGPIQTGVEGLGRTVRGLWRGTGSQSMSEAMKGSFKGMKTPTFGGGAKSLMFKELPVIGGLSGLSSRTNPLEAVKSPFSNPFKPSVDNVDLPSFMSMKPDGGLDLDTDSGDYYNMLQAAEQHKQLQTQIDRLEQSMPSGSDLRSMVKRREVEDTLRQLRRQQQNVGQGLGGSFSDYQSQIQDLEQSLNSTTRRLQQRGLELEQDGGDLAQYMSRTEGNPLSSLWHAMPFVNPEERGQRILDNQDHVGRNLEILSRLRQDLSQALPGMSR